MSRPFVSSPSVTATVLAALFCSSLTLRSESFAPLRPTTTTTTTKTTVGWRGVVVSGSTIVAPSFVVDVASRNHAPVAKLERRRTSLASSASSASSPDEIPYDEVVETDSAVSDDDDDDDNNNNGGGGGGLLDRLKGVFRKKSPDDLTFKQKLAKAGMSVVLSYGFVSNMSYCVSVTLAWYGFTKKTGLSPLAPDQWKPFLAVYAGFYVFNNLIRPLRFALSAYVATYFDDAVSSVERRTGLSRKWSFGVVVFLANIVGTTTLMCLGISLASAASGVPVFVSKGAAAAT